MKDDLGAYSKHSRQQMKMIWLDQRVGIHSDHEEEDRRWYIPWNVGWLLVTLKVIVLEIFCGEQEANATPGKNEIFVTTRASDFEQVVGEPGLKQT